MSDNCKFQGNIKYGNGALLNYYANDIAEFMAATRDLISNAPEIMAAEAAFRPSGPPQTAPMAERTTPLPHTRTAQQSDASPPPAEMKGIVEKVDIQSGVGKTGKPYTKFVVFVGGAKTGTFDGLLGKVAQTLVGKEAFFVAEKGAYGYDLKNIRPA